MKTTEKINMIKIEIKNRFTGSIIFEYEKENNTVKQTVKEFIRQEIEVNKKSRADLSYADLTYANLSRADLSYADLSYADLSYADLTDTDLSRADLSYADLTDTDLSRADLTDTDLSRADLSRADLTSIKNDFWEILLKSKSEIAGLKEALINGNVDGSTYKGDCCCLVGTIANVKHCEIDQLEGIKPNSSRPAERWFLGIRKNDTPDKSKITKLTLEWIEEFELYLNAK